MWTPKKTSPLSDEAWVILALLLLSLVILERKDRELQAYKKAAQGEVQGSSCEELELKACLRRNGYSVSECVYEDGNNLSIKPCVGRDPANDSVKQEDTEH